MFWFSASLAQPTIARIREFAEKRVWPQRHGLVVAHCDHSILCRLSREAPAANQCHYRDRTTVIQTLSLNDSAHHETGSLIFKVVVWE